MAAFYHIVPHSQGIGGNGFICDFIQLIRYSLFGKSFLQILA